MAFGLLSAVVLLAFAWVAVLRRRVGRQTRIIAQKLQTEAALKERYVELFENANDMVFTHDLAGRITSINKAGERLLQRPPRGDRGPQAGGPGGRGTAGRRGRVARAGRQGRGAAGGGVGLCSPGPASG